MATSAVNSPEDPETTSAPAKFRHIYHADATLFDINLEKPVLHSEKHAQIGLRGPHQKYDHQAMGPYQLRGLISYGSGYTHVAAHETEKAYTTLTTGAVENLNVLDVLTADRIVGQIYTEYLKRKDCEDPNESDPVPVVTFIGTRFENLRICGQEIDLDWDIEVVGGKLKDGSYVNAEKLLGNPSTNKVVNMPEHQSAADGPKPKPEARAVGSLVKVTKDPAVGIRETEYCIFIPHFGRIYLGELEICRVPGKDKKDHDAYHVKLNMVRLAMGCIAAGKGTAVALDTNGGGKGSGGG
jgi:hypothetical protein